MHIKRVTAMKSNFAMLPIYFALWCCIFAMFVAILSFFPPGYPQKIEEWTRSKLLWYALSVLTLMMGAVAYFELYKQCRSGGGGSGGAEPEMT